MSDSKSLIAVLVLFITILFLSGCSDNDVVSPGTYDPPMLSKIFQDSNNYTSFQYENGKLFRYEQVSKGKILTSIELNYDGKEKPQSEIYLTESGEFLKQYYYNSSFDGRLDSMHYKIKDGTGSYQLIAVLKYSYDGTNQLIKKEQLSISNQLVFSTDYSFYFNGNIIEKRLTNPGGLSEVTTSKYDDKINPLYYLKDWLNYEATKQKNNVISRKMVRNSSEFNLESRYTYEYNDAGLPISRTVSLVTSSGIDSSYTETYQYL